MNIKGSTLIRATDADVAEDGTATIPDGVKIIGDGAFYGCTLLASVSIPDSVTSIGYSAFDGCTSLASVTISDGVKIIGNWAFNRCTSLASVTISDGVTSIGNCAFDGCTSLASVTISDGVKIIGNWAFNRCTSLASVTISDGVKIIGNWAFDGCTSLASVTISDGVKIIGDWAFNRCTSLASVSIPDSVTSIGDGAFYGCTLLREIQSQGKIQKVVCIDGYVMTEERRRTIGDTEYIEGKILIRYDNGRWKTEKCTAAIRDGVSAHGETARTALRDLKFKLAERRGAAHYENVGLDDVFSLDDMISMYRVITGACAFGVNHFIGGLNTVKEQYTPREVIELTRDAYGGRAFREFFEKKGS